MSETLAERVAGVVEHNTGGPQSDVIDREHIMAILSGNNTHSPEQVERGIKQALEQGLIQEKASGYAPPDS